MADPPSSPHQHDDDDVEGFESGWQSIVGGSLAGMAGILIGQPFDTIRVYLQTKPWIKGPFACYGLIVRTEGHLALFKGVAPPLIGGGLLNSVLFGLYERTSHSMSLYNKEHYGTGKLSMLQIFFAGMVAGAGATLIATPMELIKTQLQMQIEEKKKPTNIATARLGQPQIKLVMPNVLQVPLNSHPRGGVYTSTWDCLVKVIRIHGFKALCMGMIPCAWRDFFGYAVYFTVYERIKTILIPTSSASNDTAHTESAITSSWMAPVYLILAGGIAGSAGWMTVYPYDVVKSRLQAQPLLHPNLNPTTGTQKLMTMRECMRIMYKEGGLRVFTVGLGTTIARAFPMDAATFLVYELFSRLVNGA